MRLTNLLGAMTNGTNDRSALKLTVCLGPSHRVAAATDDVAAPSAIASRGCGESRMAGKYVHSRACLAAASHATLINNA